MKIYLIGMPGSGKSTLGKMLAESRGLLYVDLDVEVEKKAGKSISEIFVQDGEFEFRQMEASLIREISGSNKSFIMSTGGGAPCHHNNLDFMNESGMTLYLKVSVSELARRLEKEKSSRPLLAKSLSLKKKIEELITSRESCYNGATVVLESDSITLKELESVLPKS